MQAAVEAVGFLMVDAACGVFRVERVPMCGFVSMKDGAGVDDLLNEGNAVSLCLRDCREGPDLAFASNDHTRLQQGGQRKPFCATQR